VSQQSIRWRKASYSGNLSNCIEVASLGRHFAVRDTKDRSGPVLAFDRTDWTPFLASIR
jgi:hypothetical protein